MLENGNREDKLHIKPCIIIAIITYNFNYIFFSWMDIKIFTNGKGGPGAREWVDFFSDVGITILFHLCNN